MNPVYSPVALVTGASSGIGRACALHLAKRGFLVYAASRGAGASLAAELRAQLPASARLEVVQIDVDQEKSVRDGVARVVAAVGRIDAVVHCAGFGIGGAVEDTSDDEAKAIFETNVFGALRLCRAALPTMRCHGSGTLIFVSSIGGRVALPFQGLYSATKFALEGVAESLSMEVRGHGVRVVLIEPGDFCTGFTDRRARVRGSSGESPYHEDFERALTVIESDERGGSTPDPIARLVQRILASRRPRLRYTIGPLPQRLAVQLKKVLPGRAFESILRLYYRLGVGSPRARSARGPRRIG
jgi:NAD(P)-dependent dehydrogenase (short-subunit alcohol dehydrogenase family)